MVGEGAQIRSSGDEIERVVVVLIKGQTRRSLGFSKTSQAMSERGCTAGLGLVIQAEQWRNRDAPSQKEIDIVLQ